MECLNAIDCRCRINPLHLIHGTDATFYPKAGCFKMGQALYSMRPFHDSIGKHFWEMFITNSASTCRRNVLPYRPDSVYYAFMHIVTSGDRMSFPVERISTAVHIWRIQRAMRSFLKRRLQIRRLAIVMGLHPRLGNQCSMACLPAEVLQKTLQLFPI